MLIRNSLIHCIRKIKEFLQKDIGEKYEHQLAQKFKYEGTTVSHKVISGASVARESSRRPSSTSLSVADNAEKPGIDDAKKGEVGDGQEASAQALARSLSELKIAEEDDASTVAASSAIVADDAEKPGIDEAKKQVSPLSVDRDEAKKGEMSDGQEASALALARSLSELKLDKKDDASTVAASSAMARSPSPILMSRDSGRESGSPKLTSHLLRGNPVDAQRLKNGETWGAVMNMDLDSFRDCYVNTLKGVALEDMKRLVLIRFLRALDRIEANNDLPDVELKALVDVQVAEALDLLAFVRDGAAYTPIRGFRIEHGEGESEFHVRATKFTLDHTETETKRISCEQYKLPCNIFDLTREMLNSKNVLLLALNTGFGYLAESFFYESRALAIQVKYSQLSLSAHYSYLWEMQFSAEFAHRKR